MITKPVARGQRKICNEKRRKGQKKRRNRRRRHESPMLRSRVLSSHPPFQPPITHSPQLSALSKHRRKPILRMPLAKPLHPLGRLTLRMIPSKRMPSTRHVDAIDSGIPTPRPATTKRARRRTRDCRAQVVELRLPRIRVCHAVLREGQILGSLDRVEPLLGRVLASVWVAGRRFRVLEDELLVALGREGRGLVLTYDTKRVATYSVDRPTRQTFGIL